MVGLEVVVVVDCFEGELKGLREKNRVERGRERMSKRDTLKEKM